MNWQKQMEEILSTWTETQRRVWDQWMDSVKGMAPGAEHVQAQYHQQLDAWEQAVREALARQQEWAESMSKQSGQGAGQQELAEQWMGQVQEAMKGWTQAQSQLWNTWMENMQRMEGAGGEMPWKMNGEEVMKAWQKAAEQAQQTMEEWSRATGAVGTAGTAGTKAGASRSGGGKGGSSGSSGKGGSGGSGGSSGSGGSGGSGGSKSS